MRKLDKILLPLVGSLLLLSACSRSPLQMTSPYVRGYQSAPSYNQADPYAQPYSAFQAQRGAVRAVDPLVAVEGFVSGDNLNVKGPFFTSGKGKVLNLTPDAFKIEFSIVNYHLIVDATRIDASHVHFVTTDVNAGKTFDETGTYKRTGNVTVFDMGAGAQVEKLTVRPGKAGAFEADVVQPGRMYLNDSRGSNTLKFTKG